MTYSDDDFSQQLKIAAMEMLDDYMNDKELIGFNQLDFEDFAEAR